jgi:hypothetical protein
MGEEEKELLDLIAELIVGIVMDEEENKQAV